MKQLLRVDTGLLDGDESGNEWPLHYVLYETTDEDESTCFDLFTDDGNGNGVMVCRGYHLGDMRSMALLLGRFVEWSEAA